MKRNKLHPLLLCLILTFILSGCVTERVTDSQNISIIPADSTFISDVLPEDCLLCGESKKTLLPLYRGQKNVGIININTFDISPVIINRYDDAGNLIEETADNMLMTTNHYEKSGLTVQISPDTNRGYANIDIFFKADSYIKINQMQMNLCTDCINNVWYNAYSDTPYTIGVINFDTLEVRLLDENITDFTFGDYYISCDYKERQANEDTTEINLLIFYCPERYS